LTPAAAIAEAKKGSLRPVYVITGEERYLRDQVVRELRAAALGNGLADFNEDKFTAGEVDVDKVISAARTVPMMAPRRVVLLRSVERWDAGGDARASDAGDHKRLAPLDRLAEYAQAPIDSTCMVLTASKLDGRRKLSAIAKKQGFVVQCDVLDRRELPGFIVDRCAERKTVIDRDLADLLAEIAGPELGHVVDAIERLALYVGDGNPITEEAISTCVARVRMADTWAVVGAVAQRDLKAALVALAEAYDPRDHGLPLLGALAWSIRQLARFDAARSGGASVEEAAKTAGAFQSFRARELASRAKLLRPKEIERWLVVLAETDVALKSSRRPADAILEEMLTKLCRARA
jgi:DNA polymerase III subunit delta